MHRKYASTVRWSSVSISVCHRSAIYIHASMYPHIHVYIRIYKHVYIYHIIHASMYPHIHVYIRIYKHVYIYTALRLRGPTRVRMVTLLATLNLSLEPYTRSTRDLCANGVVAHEVPRD